MFASVELDLGLNDFSQLSDQIRRIRCEQTDWNPGTAR